MTIVKEKVHVIDEIIKDLFLYLEPKLLKDEYSGFLDINSADIDGIKKYRDILMDVRYAWQKTQKYAQYFEEFYPPESKIEKFEVLNHHIHAYLQDMTTLKNKIEVLLGKMKNDIRKVASNKSEIDTFFRVGVKKTKDIFKEISKHRDTHHHQGMRFCDNDLLKAENAYGASKLFSDPTINSVINQKYIPVLLEKFEKEKEESFEVGKKRWIRVARRNNKQVSDYLNILLEGIRPNLNQLLNIQPARELISASRGKA